MKKFKKILSYVVVAALASAITMALTLHGGTSADRTSKLDQLADLIEDRFIGEADRTAMEDAAADAMVDSLGDRWSYYIPASEYDSFREQMANAYVGIGVTIQLSEQPAGLLVTKVEESGPAFEAGIRAGDLIVAVDGQDVTQLDLDTTSAMVKGEEGTFVEITVNRDGAEVTCRVERRTIQTVVATGQMIDGTTGLVTITNFDSRCAEETLAAIESLLEQGAQALIFDVRYNPGGYVRELVKVLDYLLPEGELFRSVDYRGQEDVETSDADCLEGIPFAVLINGSSYSAAEFFAAALREYDAAFLVGEPTVGKGYYQITYELSDGSAVGLSVGKYYTPNGVSLAEEGGLIPDIVVEVDDTTAAAIYAGTLDPMEDPQILAALEKLNGQ